MSFSFFMNSRIFVTLLAISAGMLGLLSPAQAQTITGSLSGFFYYDSAQSISTVGTPGSTTAGSSFNYIQTHATPTGTFTASKITYSGADNALIKPFLGTGTGGDGNSYVGDTTKTLQDGILDLKGTITFSAAATYTFSTTSDDGSALFINGTEVVNNDGVHGSTTVSNTYVVSAAAAKTQSFEVVYFNHNYNNGTGTGNFSLASPTGVSYQPTPASPGMSSLGIGLLTGLTVFGKKRLKRRVVARKRIL